MFGFRELLGIYLSAFPSVGIFLFFVYALLRSAPLYKSPQGTCRVIPTARITRCAFTSGETDTIFGPPRRGSWYPEPLVESQHTSVSTTMMMRMTKKNQGRWCGHSDTLQRISGLRMPRCDEQDVSDSWSRLERISGRNEFPKRPYLASSPRSQEPLRHERDIADGTTSPPSSTSTTPLLNGSPHPVPRSCPNSSFPHTCKAALISPILSIRQQHPAYPNNDFCAEILRHIRTAPT